MHRAFVEYVCVCVLFEDVTVREIRGRCSLSLFSVKNAKRVQP